MNAKPSLWIGAVCFGIIITAGLWYALSRGPEAPRPETPPCEVAVRNTVGIAVPIAAVPASDLEGGEPSASPAAPPTSDTPQTPAMNDSPSPSPSSTPSTPVTPVTPVVATTVTVDPSVARFADASIPVEKRSVEVEQLGKSGDANAVQTLMKLGDTYTYLNFKAVEALGNVKTPEVARYLERKLADPDPKVVAFAMRSLAQAQGAEAVTAIAAAIAANRQRPDGFQDTVCAAGVKALGEIGSAKAVPALAEEFEKTVGKTLLHEYGSQVVAAIKAIGDASGAPTLKAYLVRLENEHAAMADNPMGQRYLEGKIKETNEALDSLRN